jgi:AbrB family looped-hinge helix DNA binding protein
MFPVGSSTVTSKGQITIPAQLARAMGMQRGDRLSLSVLNGSIVAQRIPRRDPSPKKEATRG